MITCVREGNTPYLQGSRAVPAPVPAPSPLSPPPTDQRHKTECDRGITEVPFQHPKIWKNGTGNRTFGSTPGLRNAILRAGTGSRLLLLVRVRDQLGYGLVETFERTFVSLAGVRVPRSYSVSKTLARQRKTNTSAARRSNTTPGDVDPLSASEEGGASCIA